MPDDRFNNCKGILLDFGGTLDSDGEHWLDRFYALYETASLGVPQPEIKRAFYAADGLLCNDPSVTEMGLRPLMEYHVRLQFKALNIVDPERANQMVDAFCTQTEGYLRRNAQILERLTRRYRLGVVSNFYGNVARLCEEAGFSASLEVILDSTRLGIGKPNPEIFRIALNRLGLSPEETLFVGDSYDRDMMPARKIGMKTVWLKGPNPRIPPHAAPPDATLSSLTGLEALLP